MATGDPAFNPNTALGTATVGTGLTLSGGVLSNPSVGATFITQTASGDLSAEQALASLATGLLKNTTTTGVLTIASSVTDYLAPEANRESQFTAWANSVVTFTDAYTVGDDHLANNWTESNANNGTTKRGARSKVLMNTSATASGLAILFFGSNRNSSGFPLFFPSATGSKFAFEMRLKLTTAIDSVAEMGMGDGTEWFVGCRGASSTGFWVARFSNGPTTLTSSIAVDSTTFHRFRLWRDGSTTSFQVDSETPVTSANAWATNEERFQGRAFNGGTATAREHELDYAFLRAERT
jgi:hypothetical protein